MPSEKETRFKAFAKYFPESAAPYCFGLWQKHKFEFKIKNTRKRILGNYIWRDGKDTITINRDLNPYAFTVTYLHEVAHLETRIKYLNRKIKPHGKEWKLAFKTIVAPLLSTDVFPEQVLNAIKHYMTDPKAASCSSPVLVKALAMFDENNDHIHLDDLEIGDEFIFQGRKFKKMEIRRTRSLCLETETGRQFLISLLAKVKLPTNGEIEAEKVAHFNEQKINDNKVRLEELPNQTRFGFQNRQFIKLELKRTRVLCRELVTGKLFLIQGSSRVLPLRIT